MTTHAKATYDPADPWDAGLLFLFGFIAGMSSLGLILLAFGAA